MEWLLNAGKYLWDNHQEILSAANGLFASVIAVCLLIPGPQPEKFLQGVVEFLKKFSRK